MVVDGSQLDALQRRPFEYEQRWIIRGVDA